MLVVIVKMSSGRIKVVLVGGWRVDCGEWRVERCCVSIYMWSLEVESRCVF